MAEYWSGISDNTGIIKVYTSFNIDSISRTNNTVTFNNMYCRNWTPTAGAYNATPWYDDIYNNAGTVGFIGGWQSKPNTGTSIITNNQYYTAGTSPSVTVAAGDTVYYFKHRINTDGVWRDWIGPIGANIPVTTNPSLSTQSVSLIKHNSAKITWTSATGNYCTFSSLQLQYGLTTGYGTNVSGAQNSNTTLTGLKPGKTYYYRFYMVNGAGRTAYSAGYSFKTKGVAGHTPLLARLV